MIGRTQKIMSASVTRELIESLRGKSYAREEEASGRDTQLPSVGKSEKQATPAELLPCV